MSEWTVKIFGVALLCLMLTLVLRKWNADMAILVRAVAAVVLCAASVYALRPILDFLRSFAEYESFESAFPVIGVLFRALAVAMLTEVCASICRDCGEGTLATYVELGGRIEMILLSIPLLEEITRTVRMILDN